MTLIEQQARRGAIPCADCPAQVICGDETRARCPARRTWATDWRRAAYRAHLAWMERHARWPQAVDGRQAAQGGAGGALGQKTIPESSAEQNAAQCG